MSLVGSPTLSPSVGPPPPFYRFLSSWIPGGPQPRFLSSFPIVFSHAQLFSRNPYHLAVVIIQACKALQASPCPQVSSLLHGKRAFQDQ